MHAYYVVSRIRKLLLGEANVVSPTTGNRTGIPIQMNVTSKHTLHNTVLTCWYIPQQINEMTTMNVVEILPKTMMSFLNMRTASAPIQNTEARVKYWIRTEATVQPMLFSVRSTPMTNTSNMRNIARQSWM